jgi:hypothetical protein
MCCSLSEEGDPPAIRVGSAASLVAPAAVRRRFRRISAQYGSITGTGSTIVWWQGAVMIVIRVRVIRALAVPALAAALVACGGPAAAPAPSTPVPPAAAGGPAATDDTAACPLDVDDLDSATGLTWTLGRSIADHPLETVDGVTADVCVFTSADRPQMGGDPLVLRTDVVDGPQAARMRDEFASTCTGNGGTVAATSVDAATVCRSGGQAIEGQVAAGDRTVDVYVVAADQATASELTPSFEKVLAAVG